jgi:large subunit ribosomal protein L25
MIGKIPAVFYGPDSQSVPLLVQNIDLLDIMKGKTDNVFIKLIFDQGGKKTEKLSIIKELQRDNLSRRILHADFYELAMDQKVTFDIPIHIIGVAAGIQNGGELHQLKREIRISCLPKDLPEKIELDVSSLEIGDVLHVEDVKFADSVTIIDHMDAALVTVAAPRIEEVAKPAEELEAGPTEPEVIKQKAEEKEA